MSQAPLSQQTPAHISDINSNFKWMALGTSFGVFVRHAVGISVVRNPTQDRNPSGLNTSQLVLIGEQNTE